MKYPSYHCQKCGEFVGWLGRLLRFTHKCKAEEPKSTSPDPFPKWKWMMDYCKQKGMSPTIGWDLAEKAWKDKENKL